MEDKLTHEERVRLECLALAQNAVAIQGIQDNFEGAVVETATTYEKFVKEG